MKAKTLLERIRQIDARVQNKTAELQLWDNESTGVANKLRDEIFALRCERDEIIELIETLPQKQYELMYMRYVSGLSYTEIMDKTGKSYTWATSTHKIALDKVQQILDRRTE